MGGTRDLMRTLACGEPKALALLQTERIPGAFQIDNGGPWRIPKAILAKIAAGELTIGAPATAPATPKTDCDDPPASLAHATPRQADRRVKERELADPSNN
jgi:hypothetical protein